MTSPITMPQRPGRTVEEWIGATPDTPVPPRVRLRVFDRDGGQCQCGCTRRIFPGDRWDTDHIRALINGGQNRESNLQTLLAGKGHHGDKTADDTAEKSRTYHKRLAHVGIRRPRTITRWRKFNGDIVYASRER